MTDKQFNDRGIIAFIFILIVVILNSCSSTKKSFSKSTHTLDSVQVSISSIDKETNLSISKKVDSSGTSTKDKNKTWEKETVIEYDTLIGLPSNGDASDYIPQRIKRIVIKERGQKTSKEVASSNKLQEDKTDLREVVKEKRSDSTALHSNTTTLQKNKSKSFNPFKLLWLLIPAGIGLAYWKRKQIKAKLFGST